MPHHMVESFENILLIILPLECISQIVFISISSCVALIFFSLVGGESFFFNTPDSAKEKKEKQTTRLNQQKNDVIDKVYLRDARCRVL